MTMVNIFNKFKMTATNFLVFYEKIDCSQNHTGALGAAKETEAVDDEDDFGASDSESVKDDKAKDRDGFKTKFSPFGDATSTRPFELRK